MNFLYGYINRSEEFVQEQRKSNSAHAQNAGATLFM